jgi:ATP-binding cassette subfamily B multidrug efflux pump
MLIELLRRYLRPYRRPLTAVLVFQLIATIASLYLPSLNADIIDNGVARGDTSYILDRGMFMLGITVVQIIGSIIAVYFGARTAMGFGRDVRGAVFNQVGRFSEREVAQFGAPSLITRSTNDVQQVQMVLMMATTLLVMAPIMCVGGIIMALREDVGLSWLMVVAVPTLIIAIGFIV